MEEVRTEREPGTLKFDPEFTAKRYDDLADGENRRWKLVPHMRVQKAIYLQQLRERIGPGDHVLDAGCGPATFTTAIIERGASVTCLDLSEVQLELCQRSESRAAGYLRASITDLPLAAATFDVALALGASLSYCFDRTLDALCEIRRVTRPGGIVGLSVANLMGAIHRWLPAVFAYSPDVNRAIVRTGDQARDLNGHEIHLFRPDELHRLLEDAGLTAIELHAPGWLSLLHEQVPEEGTDNWKLLLEMELEASRESPGAGTHIVAWARVPNE